MYVTIYTSKGMNAPYARLAGQSLAMAPAQLEGNGMELTHTIKRYGGEVPSLGGVGGYVTVDPVVRVSWNDSASTCLIVTLQRGRVEASAYHGGKRYELQHRPGTLEDVAASWISAITERLQAKRLQDRVRGGVPRHEVAARVQAWNRKLQADRAA